MVTVTTRLFKMRYTAHIILALDSRWSGRLQGEWSSLYYRIHPTKPADSLLHGSHSWSAVHSLSQKGTLPSLRPRSAPILKSLFCFSTRHGERCPSLSGSVQRFWNVITQRGTEWNSIGFFLIQVLCLALCFAIYNSRLRIFTCY